MALILDGTNGLTYTGDTASSVNFTVPQNLGIGTNSPKTRFQATGTSLQPVPALGTASGTAFISNSDTNYGILMGVQGSGSAWMQVQRTDATATAYDLLLQPSGGNVGVGVTSTGAKLDVVSSGLPFRIAASTSSGYALAQFGQSATASQNWHIGSEGDGTFRWYNGVYGAGTERVRIDSSGNVGINTSVMNVYDAVAVNRPLVVARSDTSTSNIGSAASLTISNLDTTTNNVSQINFAAITGANTNHFSSAIISAIHGARVNGQYPTGILTFSTSTATNNAPSEKLRITNVGTVQYSNAYASSFHVDTTPAAISVAASGTIDVGSTTIPFSGMVMVNSFTTGGITIYLCGGGSVVAVSSVIGAVGTMTYVPANNGYRWTNNTAAAVTVGMFIVRTRTNA